MASLSPVRGSALRLHSKALRACRSRVAVRYQPCTSLASLFQEPVPRPAAHHTVFSGIQPTGVPHLGNYLGALRQWKHLQDQAPEGARCIYCIVDLHALTTTTPQEAQELRRSREETLASLLAIGLDPDRSTIYFQSGVTQHAQLMWILSCHASMGHLSRMTQWKSKMSLSEDAELTTSIAGKNLKLGLFSYPVLQAADILLHQSTIIPVGEDQRQHIEFARSLAASFNHLYDDVFALPEAHISPAKRVMSLQAPISKMSKSDPNPMSRVLLTDSKEDILNKVRKARTDSIQGITYDRLARPGVSNLVEILFNLRPEGAQSCEDLARDLGSTSMGALKERVASSIEDTVGPIRERLYENLAKKDELSQLARRGRKAAADSAKRTTDAVQAALGCPGVDDN